MADNFGNTLGDRLGAFIGVDLADHPIKGDPIANQAERRVSAQAPGGGIESVVVAENRMRDDLIRSWEQIGRKLIEFLASMNKGSSAGFVIGLSSGERIEYSPGSIKVTVGENSTEINSIGVKSASGSAVCELGASSAELRFGNSSVKASASGVKVIAPLIELN